MSFGPLRFITELKRAAKRQTVARRHCEAVWNFTGSETEIPAHRFPSRGKHVEKMRGKSVFLENYFSSTPRAIADHLEG